MEPSTHSIRLAGPWSVDWIGPDDVPPRILDVRQGTFPVDWTRTFGEIAGTARFSRKFNTPTGLSDAHRVWLAIPDYCGMLSIELNGRVLAILPEDKLPVRLDITDSLQMHNQLALDVTADPGQCDPTPKTLQPVQLVIVEPTAN